MPGYDAKQLDDLDDKYRYCCPICFDLMKKTVQTCCGHRFCGECFQKFNK